MKKTDRKPVDVKASAPIALDDEALGSVAGGLISPSVTTTLMPWWYSNIINYGNPRGIQ